MTVKVKQVSTMLLLVLSLSGCAQHMEKVVLPLPPETARFEYIGTYGSEADFKNSVVGFLTGDAGVGGAGFVSVMGMATTTDDRLLVCDVNQQQVKILDLEGQSITTFSEHDFISPVSVASDRQGLVYVSDSGAKEVLVFSPVGQLLRKIGDDDVLKRPAFLLVNDDLGRLYVSDPEANNVKVFNLNGELLFTFGKVGVDDGEMYVPQGMAFDSAGQLFLADSLNARVQVFTADGEFVRSFGERGTFDHQMEAPKDLAFDSEGHLYMTDSRKPRFKVVEPEDNTFLLAIGGEDTMAGKLGFTLPSGIVVDSLDRVYIGDFMLGRVTIWQYLSAAYLQRSQQKAKSE